MAKVFLACPTYDNTINAAMSQAVWATATRQHKINVSIMGQSLLANNFNKMWCDALNRRDTDGLTHFAMLHSDIQPQNYWLDTLIAELEANDADVMSACIPIKDNRGLTSTAFGTNDPWRIHSRLTLRQVLHPSFPKTFDVQTAADAVEALPEDLRLTDVPRHSLLVNTGMWVCPLNRLWAEKVHFEIRDSIAKEKSGFVAKNIPEDWNFSRQLKGLNARVMATTKVPVIHFGVAAYGTTVAWGDEIDNSALSLAL